jgi:hypothetical protein
MRSSHLRFLLRLEFFHLLSECLYFLGHFNNLCNALAAAAAAAAADAQRLGAVDCGVQLNSLRCERCDIFANARRRLKCRGENM